MVLVTAAKSPHTALILKNFDASFGNCTRNHSNMRGQGDKAVLPFFRVPGATCNLQEFLADVCDFRAAQVLHEIQERPQANFPDTCWS